MEAPELLMIVHKRKGDSLIEEARRSMQRGEPLPIGQQKLRIVSIKDYVLDVNRVVIALGEVVTDTDSQEPLRWKSAFVYPDRKTDVS